MTDQRRPSQQSGAARESSKSASPDIPQGEISDQALREILRSILRRLDALERRL